MGMYVRTMFRRSAANMLFTAADIIGNHRREFYSTPANNRGLTSHALSAPTPVAYSTFQGIAFQSGHLEVMRRISFVTKPLFLSNLALKCEAGVSIPGVANHMIKFIPVEQAVEDEIRLFLKKFANGEQTVDPNAFIDLLRQNLRWTLIQSRGIYLSHTRFEYVRI